MESQRDIAAYFLCIQLPFNCHLPLLGNESNQPVTPLCVSRVYPLTSEDLSPLPSLFSVESFD